MENPANSQTILTGIAAILGAIAWPVAVVTFAIIHRKRLNNVIDVLLAKLSAATKVKIGQFELENAIDEEVEKTQASVRDGGPTDKVPASQIQAAKRLEKAIENTHLAKFEILASVKPKMFAFAKEYEEVRKRMESGHDRTRAMNEIVAKMRTIASAARPLLGD